MPAKPKSGRNRRGILFHTDRELHHQLKHLATDHDETLAALVLRLVKDGMARESAPRGPRAGAESCARRPLERRPNKIAALDRDQRGEWGGNLETDAGKRRDTSRASCRER